MKLKYTYMGQEHTIVKLNEKDYAGVKVRHGQTIESDRDPRYFLNAGFVSQDIKKQADIDYVAGKLKLNKSVAKAEKKASDSIKEEVKIQELTVAQLKDKLTEMGVKFRGNTGRVKLEAMYRSELNKQEVAASEENAS